MGEEGEGLEHQVGEEGEGLEVRGKREGRLGRRLEGVAGEWGYNRRQSTKASQKITSQLV